MRFQSFQIIYLNRLGILVLAGECGKYGFRVGCGVTKYIDNNDDL